MLVSELQATLALNNKHYQGMGSPREGENGGRERGD